MNLKVLDRRKHLKSNRERKDERWWTMVLEAGHLFFRMEHRIHFEGSPRQKFGFVSFFLMLPDFTTQQETLIPFYLLSFFLICDQTLLKVPTKESLNDCNQLSETFDHFETVWSSYFPHPVNRSLSETNEQQPRTILWQIRFQVFAYVDWKARGRMNVAARIALRNLSLFSSVEVDKTKPSK